MNLAGRVEVHRKAARVRYLEKVSAAVAPRLSKHEVVLAAVPVSMTTPLVPTEVPARRPLFVSANRTKVVATPDAHPVAPRWAPRMVLVCTDRRVLVFDQRRFRARPGRHLSDIPLGQVADVDGVQTTSRGAAQLELVIVLSDGSATTLTVSVGFESHASMLVRRLHSRLHAA